MPRSLEDEETAINGALTSAGLRLRSWRAIQRTETVLTQGKNEYKYETQKCNIEQQPDGT